MEREAVRGEGEEGGSQRGPGDPKTGAVSRQANAKESGGPNPGSHFSAPLIGVAQEVIPNFS